MYFFVGHYGDVVKNRSGEAGDAEFKLQRDLIILMNARRGLHFDPYINVFGIGKLSAGRGGGCAGKLRRIKYDRYVVGAVVGHDQIRLSGICKYSSSERNRIRVNGDFDRWGECSVAEPEDKRYGIIGLR